MIETRMRGGQKVYRARVRVCKQDYSQTFEKETDALEWEARMTSEAYQQRYFQQKTNGMLLVSTLIDKYMAENDLSKSVTGQLKWWKEQIGHVPVDRAKASLINECKQKLLSEPYYRKHKPFKRSNATVNRYLAAISVVFSYACRDWDLIPLNPCSKVRKLKEAPGRVRYLSKEELKRLYWVIRDMKHPILLVVFILAIYTGARKMEILGLRWGDVEMSEQKLIFRKTKNGEIRFAILVDEAWELFMNYYRMQNPKSLSEYVFPSQNGKKPFCIRKAFKAAMDRAGIFDFRFHDLRHTAASYLVKVGANTTCVADVLGHKSLSMVKRYAHVMPEYRRECLEKMSKTYCEIVPISSSHNYMLTDNSGASEGI